MKWISVRDRLPVTEKQLKLIADMEEFVGEKFHGKTIAEASAWIDGHMDYSNCSLWILGRLSMDIFKGND